MKEKKEISDMKGFERSLNWLIEGREMMRKDPEQDTAQNKFLASIAQNLVEIHRLMLISYGKR